MLLLIFLSVRSVLSFCFAGAIFDASDKATKTGFLFGIQRFNAKPEKTFELSALVDNISVADSFQLASSCKGMHFCYVCYKWFNIK